MFTIQLARASTTMSSVSISSPCWFINSFTLVGIFEQALSLCFCQVLYLWVELETGRWTGIVFVLQEFLVLTGNRLSVNSEKKWHDKIMLWWRQIMWFSGGPEHCAPKSEVASHSAGADFEASVRVWWTGRGEGGVLQKQVFQAGRPASAEEGSSLGCSGNSEEEGISHSEQKPLKRHYKQKQRKISPEI